MIIKDGYKQILQADEFIKNFDTMEGFKNWCLTGDEDDLNEALKVFEAYELYEHCKVIKDVIDELKA